MTTKKGLIYKIQKELYFVFADKETYMCKGRGILREKKIKPLVGDYVDISVLDSNEGIIEGVYPRTSELVRPPVANIDQIILVLSIKSPNINLNLVDKYLIMLEHYDIPVIMVINKKDLITKDDQIMVEEIYDGIYPIYFTSTYSNDGIDELKQALKGKISSFAGPSGVGKSTLLNMIGHNINVETGDISNKTQRGKHTTRHTELFEVDESTYILDTPGFSSLDLSFIDDEKKLRLLYPDFRKLQKECKFQNCQHLEEPNCAVKKAIDENEISLSRYENYKLIRKDIEKNRRY